MNLSDHERHLTTELERLNRLYNALRRVSQSIVHAKAKDDLFQNVCRLMVDSEIFEIAFVGIHDPSTGLLDFVAKSGDPNSFLDSIQLSVREIPEGLGPAGIAFRTDQIYIANDYQSDPNTLLWHDRAKRCGIRSAAILPISLASRPIGVLAVYSSIAGYFKSEEVGLLVEATEDISFALERFENEASKKRTEAELLRYGALVRSSKDAIVSRNLEGTIETWNPAAEKMFGYRPEEAIGRHINFLVPQDRQSQFSEWHSTLHNGGGISEIETVRIHKNGSPIHVSLVGSPIIDENGDVVGVVASLRDLSFRKELNDEFESLFENWLDLLCIINAEGFFEKVSYSFTSTFGWTADELKARPFLDFVVEEDRSKTERCLAKLLVEGDNTLSFENRCLHRDGSTRILSWKAVRTSNSKIYGSARDVTELRQAEDEIRILNKDLKDRADQLEWARSEADKANKAKSEFLSRMSHELRTPLNSVLGFAQILEMRFSDPSILDCSNSILKAGTHLLDLINEVLDISRIESGNLDCYLEPLSVSETVLHAVELIRATAEDRQISITVDHSIHEGNVMADRKRLMQILLNLLSNAIKFNRDDGSIVMKCGGCTDSVCRITISDTGPGLGPGANEWLFKPFERGPNPVAPGTGLGLALSLNLARLMDGDLRLIESSSSGTTFELELVRVQNLVGNNAPCNCQAEEDSQSESIEKAKDIGELSVVYIDDSQANLDLMKQYCSQSKKFKLFEALRAENGLRLIESLNPNLIFLDLHLPDIGGLSVLEQIRSNPKTNSIPVIVISADATDVSIRSALALGAQAYLTKPIEFSSLTAELNRILNV